MSNNPSPSDEEMVEQLIKAVFYEQDHPENAYGADCRDLAYDALISRMEELRRDNEQWRKRLRWVSEHRWEACIMDNLAGITVEDGKEYEEYEGPTFEAAIDKAIDSESSHA